MLEQEGGTRQLRHGFRCRMIQPQALFVDPISVMPKRAAMSAGVEPPSMRFRNPSMQRSFFTDFLHKKVKANTERSRLCPTIK